MKEYKIIKKSLWKKDADFEEIINQFARDGWEVFLKEMLMDRLKH